MGGWLGSGIHAKQEKWPKERVHGWAPGDYTCTCRECGCHYMGAKRSVQCYPCAEKFVPPPRPETLEEKCDRLASELAHVRGELAKHGPSCDRCQSAHCCSVVGTHPGCVADPDGSLPLWMPWTNEDVRKIDDVRWAEIDRLRGELARTKRNHMRRMAQAALHREMWCKRRIVVHWDVMHRGGTRFAGLQTAIRAALAAMEGGAK